MQKNTSIKNGAKRFIFCLSTPLLPTLFFTFLSKKSCNVQFITKMVVNLR